ncbi:MAG: tetratricopeptide repeat protein [Mucilaginibacter polytrichastri]|nr:tetratricopeptide repeat protein [Mucilaginibacter polytrichastri]
MKTLLSTVFFVLYGIVAFGQGEQLKDVVNNLAFFNTQKDLKYLSEAKKAVDRSFYSTKDTSNTQKNVYRAVVYSSILYVDSNNTLGQPDTFLRYTTTLLNKVQRQQKVYSYQTLVDYSKRCLANAYLRAGTKAYNKGDFSAAAESFEKSKTMSNEIPQVDAFIARSFEKAGKQQQAGEVYEALSRKENAPLTYFQSAASSYLSVNDTSKALSVIRRGRRTYAADPYLVTQEANIYNDKKDYTALKGVLEPLLKVKPDNEDVLFLAANCLDHLNDYDNAGNFYNRLIELNPNAFPPVLNLGYLNLRKAAKLTGEGQQKSLTDAQNWLEKANELNPDDVNCLKGLQMVYQQTRNQYQLQRVNTKLKQLSK